MTPTQINYTIRTIFGVVAAVCAFLLAQQDVPLDPIIKVAIGAVSVAVAVVNPTTVYRADD